MVLADPSPSLVSKAVSGGDQALSRDTWLAEMVVGWLVSTTRARNNCEALI